MSEQTNNPGDESSPLSEAFLKRRPTVLYYGEQDENGVDLSLLRYMLQLTPLERLQLMEEKARETLFLYECGQRQRESESAKHR